MKSSDKNSEGVQKNIFSSEIFSKLPLELRNQLLGYPVFSYHNLGINNTPMHANLKLSPLTLTTGNSATLEAGQRVLRIQPNNLLHHGAPTMKGMSGGPMFMCEGGTINIMGLVQSGDSIIDENNVCIL